MQRTVSVSGLPKVTGTTRVGGVLRAAPPRFTPAAAASYQWLRDGRPIAGATRASYRLTAADVRRRIAVRVTGSSSGYRPAVVSSAPTALVGKARPTVRASAKARGKQRVRVVVRVAAPGAPATGRVTVTVRGKRVVRSVRAGRAVVDVRRVRRGKAKVVIRYAGSSAVEAKRVVRTVRVR